MLKYMLVFVLFIAVSAQNKAIAIVLKSKGSVEIVSNGKTKNVKRGTRIYHNDLIRTKKRSFAAMRYIDDRSLIRVRQNSEIRVQGNQEGSSIAKNIKLEAGNILASVTKQRSEFRVSTPTSVASVKGTEFESLFNNVSGQHITYVREGVVNVAFKGKSVDVKQNEAVVVQKDGTFEKKIVEKKDESSIGIEKSEEEVKEEEQEQEQKKVEEIEIEFRGPSGNKLLRLRVKDQ